MPLLKYADALEGLYSRYNHRRFVPPDPLEFMYLYEDPLDREVVALVASSLAYGRVSQILASVRTVLDVLGSQPTRAVQAMKHKDLAGRMKGFRHRFATGDQVAAMLAGCGRLLRRYGTLERVFACVVTGDDETVLPRVSAFVRQLRAEAPGPMGHLLCDPADGSACKRLNLMLRWLVRRDRVDFGQWKCIRPSQLVVPLDTHMHRIGLASGAIRRRQADGRAAIELTRAFMAIRPRDPVRYDFCLTRAGIHGEGSLPGFLTARALQAVHPHEEDGRAVQCPEEQR